MPRFKPQMNITPSGLLVCDRGERNENVGVCFMDFHGETKQLGALEHFRRKRALPATICVIGDGETRSGLRVITQRAGPGLGPGWSECMKGSRVRVRKIGYGSVRAL